MGNCCLGGAATSQSAIRRSSSHRDANGPNDAVDGYLKSRGYHGLFTQIELSLSASNLRDRDVLSKSDPMAVIYTKGRDGSLQEIGRTEVVLNSLNPQWIKKVIITYHFEVVQTLLFHVYDVDSHFHGLEEKMLKLDEQQLLGEGTCLLSEIVTRPNRTLPVDLVGRVESTSSTHPKKLGQLTVHAEECVVSKTTTELRIRNASPKVYGPSDQSLSHGFYHNDPFLVISKCVESGHAVPICKTEVLKNDLDPTWKPVSISISQVGSKETPLIIECFNFNSNGRHDLLGKVQKSLVELEKLSSGGEGEHLFVPVAIGKDHQTKVLKSRLFVDKFSETSNGNPRLPDSLHYIDPSGRPNAYQKAILEVGEVLQCYDFDKKFHSWGFGARPIDGPVSHCFNLNGSSGHSEVEGIHGIMMAYASALFNVTLAGPTLFGPVIAAAAMIASQALAANQKKYFVLLIITDGVITDLQETKDALVNASDLPLSILIIGVGGADFKEMEILDADKGERLESTTGRVATRDIVQFVPFRDVQGGGEISVVQSLLEELPSQFLTFMRNRDIHPNTC
ncbi:C2 calcium-dependent membrane targeting [Cynara cardunculus var. scolymus]|uniref:C2 calcium-dependent membrane targeting n=1 Tax=Cynara cardunculus var. scolymus TaxID=59895 RepID=A0A103YBM1_CYNCS|nr:C2 calcium-dependent membrane targeting [Cynara cardunculus var. scolymus]